MLNPNWGGRVPAVASVAKVGTHSNEKQSNSAAAVNQPAKAITTVPVFVPDTNPSLPVQETSKGQDKNKLPQQSKVEELTSVSWIGNRLQYNTMKNRDLRLGGGFKVVKVNSARASFCSGLAGSIIDVDDVLFNHTHQDKNHLGKVDMRTVLVLRCGIQEKRFCVKFHSHKDEIRKEISNILIFKKDNIPTPFLYFEGLSETNFSCIGMELLEPTLEAIMPFQFSQRLKRNWSDCWKACFDILQEIHARGFIHGDSGARNFMFSPVQDRWVVIDLLTVTRHVGHKFAELGKRHDIAMLYHSLLTKAAQIKNIFPHLPGLYQILLEHNAVDLTGNMMLGCSRCQGLWACSQICKTMSLNTVLDVSQALDEKNLKRVVAALNKVRTRGNGTLATSAAAGIDFRVNGNLASEMIIPLSDRNESQCDVQVSQIPSPSASLCTQESIDSSDLSGTITSAQEITLPETIPHGTANDASVSTTVPTSIEVIESGKETGIDSLAEPLTVSANDKERLSEADDEIARAIACILTAEQSLLKQDSQDDLEYSIQFLKTIKQSLQVFRSQVQTKLGSKDGEQEAC